MPHPRPQPTSVAPRDEYLPGVRVVASIDAGRFVRARGGELYVWFESVGKRSRWGTLKTATDRPAKADVTFERVDTGAFTLLLDATLRRPEELRVDLARWPRRRVLVRGFGAGPVAGDPGVGWGSADAVGGGGGGGGNGGGGL